MNTKYLTSKCILPVNSSTVLVVDDTMGATSTSFFTLPTGNTPCCTKDKAFLRAILNNFFLSIFSLKVLCYYYYKYNKNKTCKKYLPRRTSTFSPSNRPSS